MQRDYEEIVRDEYRCSLLCKSASDLTNSLPSTTSTTLQIPQTYLTYNSPDLLKDLVDTSQDIDCQSLVLPSMKSPSEKSVMLKLPLIKSSSTKSPLMSLGMSSHAPSGRLHHSCSLELEHDVNSVNDHRNCKKNCNDAFNSEQNTVKSCTDVKSSEDMICNSELMETHKKIIKKKRKCKETSVCVNSCDDVNACLESLNTRNDILDASSNDVTHNPKYVAPRRKKKELLDFIDFVDFIKSSPNVKEKQVDVTPLKEIITCISEEAQKSSSFDELSSLRLSVTNKSKRENKSDNISPFISSQPKTVLQRDNKFKFSNEQVNNFIANNEIENESLNSSTSSELIPIRVMRDIFNVLNLNIAEKSKSLGNKEISSNVSNGNSELNLKSTDGGKHKRKFDEIENVEKGDMEDIQTKEKRGKVRKSTRYSRKNNEVENTKINVTQKIQIYDKHDYENVPHDMNNGDFIYNLKGEDGIMRMKQGMNNEMECVIQEVVEAVTTKSTNKRTCKKFHNKIEKRKNDFVEKSKMRKLYNLNDNQYIDGENQIELNTTIKVLNCTDLPPTEIKPITKKIVEQKKRHDSMNAMDNKASKTLSKCKLGYKQLANEKSPVKFCRTPKNNDVLKPGATSAEISSTPRRSARVKKLFPVIKETTSNFTRRSTLEFMPQTPLKTPRKRGNIHFNKIKNSSIVCTRFHTSDVLEFQQIVEKLDKFFIEDEVKASTTHLVTMEVKRTINILRGIARGCWILKAEWVSFTDCM